MVCELRVSWFVVLFFFSSRRRHTRCYRDWSSDVCSSDLAGSGRSAGTGEQGNADPQPAARSGSRSRDPAFPRSRDNRELAHWTHKTIKKVTDDLEGFHFNTAIAALMEYVNYLTRVKSTQAGS